MAHKCDISDIMIDLLQGREGKSVLINHYITPIQDYKDRVLETLHKLKLKIEREEEQQQRDIERMDKILADFEHNGQGREHYNTMRELPATCSKMKGTVKALNMGDLGSETGKNNN
jgi:hypothetical protein